jgi:hypothetical protein
METTIKANLRTQSLSVNTNWYSNLIKKLEFSYFGIIAMTITIGSIMGGIAAMYTFQNNAPIWQVSLVMAGAMANNVSAIGQAPTKWVINMFLISLFVSITCILINL